MSSNNKQGIGEPTAIIIGALIGACAVVSAAVIGITFGKVEINLFAVNPTQVTKSDIPVVVSPTPMIQPTFTVSNTPTYVQPTVLSVSSIIPVLPTTTRTATITRTPTSPVMPTRVGMVALYDDFDNSVFEGGFDRNLWMPFEPFSGQAMQKSGILAIEGRAAPNTDLGAVLNLKTRLRVATLFEGKLKLGCGVANGTVRIQIRYLEGQWYSQCGINSSGTGGTVFCNDTIWPAQTGHSYNAGGQQTKCDEWHVFRIEVQPDTKTFTYYIDGVRVGSHIPVDATKLDQSFFVIGVAGIGTGYFDYVQLGSLTSPAPGTSWIDNFESTTLNPRWLWIDEDSTHWSLNAKPGFMRITTQMGSLYTSGNNQKNLLLTSAPMGNFRITTKVAINSTQIYQHAAILICQDDDNYILLRRGVGDGMAFINEAGGMPPSFINANQAASELFLRIEKLGNTFSGYYSLDGSNWNRIGQYTAALTSLRVGISASNNIAVAPEIPADFDFFQLDVTP